VAAEVEDTQIIVTKQVPSLMCMRTPGCVKPNKHPGRCPKQSSLDTGAPEPKAVPKAAPKAAPKAKPVADRQKSRKESKAAAAAAVSLCVRNPGCDRPLKHSGRCRNQSSASKAGSPALCTRTPGCDKPLKHPGRCSRYKQGQKKVNRKQKASRSAPPPRPLSFSNALANQLTILSKLRQQGKIDETCYRNSVRCLLPVGEGAVQPAPKKKRRT
jgi:hypothetical protein